MRNIYKLQIWLHCTDTDTHEWRDFYLDVNKICGWFMPNQPEEMKPDLGVNILYESGDIDTIKLEPHIESYLLQEFHSKCISPKKQK